MNIDLFLKEKMGCSSSSLPRILDLQHENDRHELEQLVEGGKILEVNDDYREQLREYFGVMNPSLVYTPDFQNKFQEYTDEIQQKTPLWQHGRYAYFPWIYKLVHILEDEAFQMVRTARNKLLINDAEQKKFYESVIGVAGLSVGNSVALAIVVQGGARHIKLADFDHLALSNLNRIRSGVDHLALNKAEITARQIYLLNPYAQVEIFSEGLQPTNVEKFFEGEARLDIVIDEIDNLAMKCMIREEAKKRRIPVIMATDNGDNGVVDIERYDQDASIQFFHGRIGEVSYEQLLHLNKFEIGKLATRIVGTENVGPRIQESLIQMGKTIVSWPQLGGAALLNGSAVAYCVRRILNGQPVEKDRAHISLDEKLSAETAHIHNLIPSFQEFMQ